MMSWYTAKLCDIESYLEQLAYLLSSKTAVNWSAVSYFQQDLPHEHQTSCNSPRNIVPGTIISSGIAAVGVHMTEQSSPNSVSVNTHGVLIKEDMR